MDEGFNLAVDGSCLSARVLEDARITRHLTFPEKSGSSTVRAKSDFKGRDSNIEDESFPYGKVGPAGTGFDSGRGMGSQGRLKDNPLGD